MEEPNHEEWESRVAINRAINFLDRWEPQFLLPMTRAWMGHVCMIVGPGELATACEGSHDIEPSELVPFPIEAVIRDKDSCLECRRILAKKAMHDVSNAGLVLERSPLV